MAIQLLEGEEITYFVYAGVGMNDKKVVHTLFYLTDPESLQEGIQKLREGAYNFWPDKFFKDAGLTKCNPSAIFKVVRVIGTNADGEAETRYYTSGPKAAQYVGMLSYEEEKEFMSSDREEMKRLVLHVPIDERRGMAVYMAARSKAKEDKEKYDKKYRSEQHMGAVEQGLQPYRSAYMSLTREQKRLFIAHIIEVVTS